jgi:hypothetical protein
MLRTIATILALSLVAACSPSFGSSPPPAQVIVLPPGATTLPNGTPIVCRNGAAPPCQ